MSSRHRLAAVLLLAFSVGCTGPRPVRKAAMDAPPGGVLIRGAGATFPAPLYKRWFADYSKEHPTVAVDYAAVGSGEGVRRFMGRGVDDNDLVDFGASDAAMTDEQIAAAPHGARLVPVTAGSVVLAYNLPDLGGELRLSRQAYEGIFLGEITRWNDPVVARDNPGLALPKLTIAMVVRQDGSGTTFAFTKHLDAISAKWRSRYGAATLVDWPGNAMRAAGNEGVAGRIQHSIGSIGYLNYGAATQVGLPMALLQNHEGVFVKPTAASAAATLASADLPANLRVFVPDPAGAASYPIVTFSWILLPRDSVDSPKGAAMRELFRWCLSAGQKYGPDLGYVPLPPAVTARALAALDTAPPAS
jgi:phosphate transport system substrate-binding protein